MTPRRTPRPLAVTLIGWLFIAVGAAALLQDLVPLLGSNAAAQLAKLRADGLADLGPAWASRLLAVTAGWGVLRGHDWARWGLALWMAFHVGVSLLHSVGELAFHCVVFAPILYGLFRSAVTPFFRPRPEAPG